MMCGTNGGRPSSTGRTRLGDREQMAESLAPRLPIRERMVDGHAGAVLADHACRAALVVVGHRGEGGLSGLLAGSVTGRRPRVPRVPRPRRACRAGNPGPYAMTRPTSLSKYPSA